VLEKGARSRGKQVNEEIQKVVSKKKRHPGRDCRDHTRRAFREAEEHAICRKEYSLLESDRGTRRRFHKYPFSTLSKGGFLGKRKMRDDVGS